MTPTELCQLDRLTAIAVGWVHPSGRHDCCLGDNAPGPSCIPHYTRSWRDTGPLIERYRIDLKGQHLPHWYAELNATAHGGDHACHEHPLVAVCQLLVGMAAAGRLPAVVA